MRLAVIWAMGFCAVKRFIVWSSSSHRAYVYPTYECTVRLHIHVLMSIGALRVVYSTFAAEPLQFAELLNLIVSFPCRAQNVAGVEELLGEVLQTSTVRLKIEHQVTKVSQNVCLNCGLYYSCESIPVESTQLACVSFISLTLRGF